jgi:hypothetical protein
VLKAADRYLKEAPVSITASRAARSAGRSIGIIDTIHLVEVARAIERLDGAPGWTTEDAHAVRAWFAEYLTWLTTDPFGLQERDATNNHGTCWVMQAAAFAHLTGNAAVLEFTRDRFKTVLVAKHMAARGSKSCAICL